MASMPRLPGDARRGGAALDHLLVAAVVIAGLASAVLLLFVLEDAVFALGFGLLFLSGLALAMVFARLRPIEPIVAEGADRRLLQSAIADDVAAVALTDRRGRLLVANARFDQSFAGSPTPPGLPLSEEDAKRLNEAGRAAWRDGRASAPALRSETGVFDATVQRGGDRDDYLVWRFQRASTHDLVGEARRLIEGEGGARLGQAGVMAALAGPDGRMLAANPVLRRRAMGEVGATARGQPLTDLLGTGEDGRIRVAREGEAGNPLRLIQMPLDGGGEDGAAILFFLLDEAVGAAGVGGTSTADLHALLGMLPLGLALADREGRFQYINDAFRRAAGLGEGDRPVYPSDLVDKDDKAAVSNAVRRHASGAPTSGDVAVTLKHRPEEPVALTIAGAQGLGDAAILLSLKDNSEDEKLKRQVAQATKMQAVGQLAGGVAHDFNNILTAIIGHCDLMMMRHAPGDSDYDDILQIKANSNRAAGLTRQLLAFSRQQTLRPQIIQLPDIVSEVSNLLKRLIGETVTLDVSHGRNLGPVRADPGQLEQVIVNLAVNARDAILAKGEGAGKLAIRTFAMPSAEVRAMASEILPIADYTALVFADTGIGIAPEVLGKVFEPFYTTKEVGKGTGLGLSTVYGIVKQSGGFIFAESEPGEGTQFTIYLPVHRADGEVGLEPRVARPPGGERLAELWGSGRVLIVEDEATVRAVAERALTRQGYAVVTAEDGERALERVEAGEVFDLVLSDVVMPTLDGPAMARKLREILPDVPILFMSGYAEEQLRRSIDLDAVHFLAKPFSVQQLAEAVRTILAAHDEKH